MCVPSSLGPEAQQTFLSILPKFPLSTYVTQAATEMLSASPQGQALAGETGSAGEALRLGIYNLVIET